VQVSNLWSIDFESDSSLNSFNKLFCSSSVTFSNDSLKFSLFGFFGFEKVTSVLSFTFSLLCF